MYSSDRFEKLEYKSHFSLHSPSFLPLLPSFPFLPLIPPLPPSSPLLSSSKSLPISPFHLLLYIHCLLFQIRSISQLTNRHCVECCSSISSTRWVICISTNSCLVLFSRKKTFKLSYSFLINVYKNSVKLLIVDIDSSCVFL